MTLFGTIENTNIFSHKICAHFYNDIHSYSLMRNCINRRNANLASESHEFSRERATESIIFNFMAIIL